MTKLLYSTLVASECPTPHIHLPPWFTSLPFVVSHPSHPYCIPGYLHYLLPLPPGICKACLLHQFPTHCISHVAAYSPCSTLSSLLPSLPLISLEETVKNGTFWHLEQSQLYMEPVWGIVIMFKGSLISKMIMEDTLHFQDSFTSFRSWNPQDLANSPKLLCTWAAKFRELAMLFPLRHSCHLWLQTM